MKKLTLKIDAVPHWHALGISSAERDYRLCYLINKSLEMDFARNGVLQVYVQEEAPQDLFAFGGDTASRNTKGTPVKASRIEVQVFTAAVPESEGIYYLLKNRQENFTVIPKWKKADYIILAGDEASQAGLEKLGRNLSRIQNIQSTFAIPTDLTFHIDVE
jgi:hypothetical protein